MDSLPADIVLTCVDDMDGSLLVVPLARAVSEVTAYRTLVEAGTFGDARAHPAAAALVDDWLESWLEQCEENGEPATGSDDEPVDSSEYFGENWNSVIWTDPRESTADWLSQAHADLAEEYLEDDPEVRLGGPDLQPLLPARHRQSIEERLREAGVDVRPWSALVDYYHPYTLADVDPVEALGLTVLRD